MMLLTVSGERFSPMTSSARVRGEIAVSCRRFRKFPRRLVRGADARAPRVERRETRERARPMDEIDRASPNSSAIARRARASDVNLNATNKSTKRHATSSATD